MNKQVDRAELLEGIKVLIDEEYVCETKIEDGVIYMQFASGDKFAVSIVRCF